MASEIAGKLGPLALEAPDQFGGEVLRVGRGAAIAAGEDLAVGEQAFGEDAGRARDIAARALRLLRASAARCRRNARGCASCDRSSCADFSRTPASARSARQNVALPRESRRVESVEQHRIEAAGRLVARAGRGSRALPRSGAALLASVMLAAAPPKDGFAAQAHFDEHERLAVARDRGRSRRAACESCGRR